MRFILEELHFSADLPSEVLDFLAAESTVRKVAAGALVFREGTQDGEFYLIRTGRLALEMNVPGRGAVRILTLGPGEMVGWSALLREGKMTASVIAVDDAEVVVTPADRLRELSEANHDFGFFLMRRMANDLSRRLVATRLQLLDLFADSTPPIATGVLEGQE